MVGGEEWQEKVYDGGMEEAPENSKESPHSVHANGLIDKPTILELSMYCKVKNISYMGSATVHSRVIMQAARQQLVCVANIVNCVIKLRW